MTRRGEIATRAPKVNLRRSGRCLGCATALFFACLFPAPGALGSDTAEAGVRAYQAGEHSRALEIFEQGAERGDADSQYGLGVLYLDGMAVPKDPAQSTVWFRAAARQGHTNAQFNLGNAYIFGRGVAKDPEEAAQWWHKAALKGFPNACYNLGVYYLERGETPAHRELGISWLRAASERGWEKASINLGKIGEPLYGEPPEKDWQREPVRSEARLLTVDPQALTVQLFSGGSRQSAIKFMEQRQLSEQALLYRLPKGRGVRWNVVFGAFPSPAEATKLIDTMTPQLKGSKPWPRRLSSVRASILAVWKERENTVIPAVGGDD